MWKERLHKIAPWVASVSSGLMMASSFPPLGWHDAAWVCLVPLIMACRAVPPLKACRLGFVAGAVFWLCSIHWITYVTYVGWIALSLVCALFFIPFTLIVSWYTRSFTQPRWLMNTGLIILAPVVWMGLEYIRSTICTGFPWNALGISQYRNLIIIQIADWGGVYIVSGLLIWVNTAIALTALRYVDAKGRYGRYPHPEIVLSVLALSLAFVDGRDALHQKYQGGELLRMALIQPNIPQRDKWSEEKVEMIYERLENLTAAAQTFGDVDLAVWPETALPDEVRYSRPSHDLVLSLVSKGSPLLVGAMDIVWPEGDPQHVYMNTAFLYDRDGEILQRYDKRHLVPFGEYVPLDNVFPFLKAMTPIQESFSAGHTSTVFRLDQPSVAFSSLICFEDTLARYSRESVRNGARLLINQTNDGWFDPSSASRQHMAHCVFRCIENRVPAVRCANTGVSCVIDAKGRILDELVDESGNQLVSGFRTVAVRLATPDMAFTSYTEHGDILGIGSAVVAVLLSLGVFLLEHKRG